MSFFKVGSTDVDKMFKAEIFGLLVYLLTLRRTGTMSGYSQEFSLGSIYCAENQQWNLRKKQINVNSIAKRSKNCFPFQRFGFFQLECWVSLGHGGGLGGQVGCVHPSACIFQWGHALAIVVGLTDLDGILVPSFLLVCNTLLIYSIEINSYSVAVGV